MVMDEGEQSLPASLPPDTQLAQQEEEEGVYSPTQNLPLVRHSLNTDLSGSSENVDDRCLSRACQLSDAVHQLRTQIDRHGGLEMSVGSVEDEPSPWEPLMRRLIYYLTPILKQRLDESRDPRGRRGRERGGEAGRGRRGGAGKLEKA